MAPGSRGRHFRILSYGDLKGVARMQKFIHITGAPAGGKSYLEALLEGHHDIATFPLGLTDFILSDILIYFYFNGWKHTHRYRRSIEYDVSCTVVDHMFTVNAGNSECVDDKIHEPGRRFHAGDMLFRFFAYRYKAYGSLSGRAMVGLDREHVLFLPIEFDFFDAERKIFTGLNELTWTEALPEKMAAFILEAFRDAVVDPRPRKDHAKYYISTSNDREWDTFKGDLFPKYFCGSKWIHVSRNVVDSLVVDFVGHYSEFFRYANVDGNALCQAMEALLGTGVRDVMLSYRLLHAYLAKTEPDMYKVVDFIDVTQNQEKCMREICDWLEIDFDPILCRPTYLGRDFIFPSNRTADSVSDDTEWGRRLRKTTRLEDIINERIYSHALPRARDAVMVRDYLVKIRAAIAKDAAASENGMAVYGAGELGLQLVHLLLLDEVSVKYVFDKGKPEYSPLWNTPHMTLLPSNAMVTPGQKENMPVYVSVSNTALHADIYRDLTRLGWKRVILPEEMRPVADSELL